ncbi:MAG: hypothetical protein CL489_08505 [Acidobacteria bacterium]|mgnify:CR=1 FL=1|nr:hypothetical protein [Acidobacteriota bacterium]|tara:strand:- start:46717 stop:47124 length:408 start_codon:yes stop_codon:yes gene_type:complete
MKKEQVDEMSLSEAVNYALSKIIEQGKPCKNNGYCAYGYDGNHCAIGWLLDEDDDALMGYNGSLNYLIIDYGDKVPDLIKDNTCIFEPLQKIHDVSNKEIFNTKLYELNAYAVDIDQDLLDKWIAIKENEIKTVD